MRRLILALAILCFAILPAARAQGGFTTVSGTVTDPNGLPYACGFISAQLITAGGVAPTLNGGSFSSSVSPVQLGCPTSPGTGANGSFSIRLADSGVISPATTTWKFTVTTPGIAPPSGTGPQSFTYTTAINCASNIPTTCTANALSISTPISALAPVLSLVTGGGSSFPVTTTVNVNSGGTIDVNTGGTIAPVGGGVIEPSEGPPGGTAGQVLISNGPGVPGTYQDPAVSNAVMVLLPAVAATATQTGAAIKIPLQSANGTLAITGAGITGSPSGCTVNLELQQSTGAPASASIAAQAFTPGNTYQSFLISPAVNFQNGDNMIAVYACATYPTGGTITITFGPANSVTLSSAGSVNNAISVTTADVLWTQYTSQNLCQAGCSVQSSFRIIPNSAVTVSALPAGCTLATGVVTCIWDTNPCTSAAIGGIGTGFTVPVNGWIVNYTSYVLTPAMPQGAMYLNEYILPAMPSGGGPTVCTGTLTSAQIGNLLVGGITGDSYPVSWPASGITSPMVIPGYPSVITVSSPAAGSDWGITSGTSTAINGSQRACISGMFFQLTTSATVGNRIVSVRIQQGTMQYVYVATIAQPASTTVLYSFAPGTVAQQQTLGSSLVVQTVPFTNGQPICGAASALLALNSFTGNLQAADQFSNIAIATTVQNEHD